MRTIVKGKNVEVPDRVRDYAERKLNRIERLLDDRTDAIVELWNEQHRSAADSHIAEVTLVIDGQVLRSHAAGSSYQAALDEVVDKVERQAVDHKEKPRLRARPEEEKQILRRLADGTRGRRRASRGSSRPSASRSSRCSRRTRSRAMEELGHQFFVFVNAETERVAILYRRDDGDYGIIEPIVGGDTRPSRTGGQRPVAAPASGAVLAGEVLAVISHAWSSLWKAECRMQRQRPRPRCRSTTPALYARIAST